MIESIEFQKATHTAAPTNHVLVTDISGSMYNALPELRTHLKNNLASLVKPDDTVSLIYFSSKGDFGTVFSGRRVDSASDLSELGALIDRFLKPSGCTGFVEPLRLAMDTVKGLSDRKHVNSLVFMTDGYDNCWRSSEIIDAAKLLPQGFDNITIIEYGWHCNRELLKEMATVTGATHVFAEGQEEYQVELETAMNGSMPKIRVDFSIVHTHAVYVEGTRFNVLTATSDEDHPVNFVYVPEDVSRLWVMSDNEIEFVGGVADIQTAYVVALFGVHTMNPDLVWAALKKTGDVRFINQFNNCFTKQDYTNIKNDLVCAIQDDNLRGLDGIDYNLVPAEDATTVVDVLTFLAENDVQVLTSHPMFSYKRIGRKALQKEDDTEDQLAEAISEAKTKEERKALALKLAEHEDWNPEFTPDPESKGIVDISNLVYNSERPNVSIQTVQQGTVLVPEWAQKKYGVPEEIETWRFRNFAIVKDGIINMKALPIASDDPTLVKRLKKELGVKVIRRRGVPVVILEGVPLVNRLMTKNITASQFFADHVRLESLKARQKVLKHFLREIVGPVNTVGLASKYGSEAATFLSGYGIRDYGFSPKSTAAESTDVYMSRELRIKIKGASALPAIDAVLKKLVTKHNTADKLVFKEIMEYEAFVSGPAIAKASESVRKQLIETWLKDATTNAIQEVRALNKSLSKTMYGIVAGHGWFTDLGDDEATMLVEVDGEQFTVTAELVEKEIKI
ncbi:MAG: VWA domain-containing protein [Aeromonas popoffii]|uniref:VWA domain-containing protein n=1 Tax=Aeromonas popoffii TaxID=70856 RepID=UPI003F41672C